MVLVFNTDEWHELYGLHSNIPACCVNFWVYDFQHRTFDAQVAYNDLYNPYQQMDWGYIPCPRCIINCEVPQQIIWCPVVCPYERIYERACAETIESTTEAP